MPVVTLAELLESGVHFGHQTRRWNPQMDPFIYTARNGVHIIDLVQTAQLIDEAYNYMRRSSEQGKRVLFVGTKRQAAGIIAQEASRCGAYYVNQRWLGGMLTNWETIKNRIGRLKELEQLEESESIKKRPKKEASVLRRELEKLQKYLGGIKMMRRTPDIVVIVDTRREYNAIQECQKLGIPVVAMLDTNCDPNVVDIPIPANDDAIRSIKLVVGKLADAIYEGRHGQAVSDEEYEEFEEAIGETAYEYDDEEEEADWSPEDVPSATPEDEVPPATPEAATPPASQEDEQPKDEE
ncbi:MAG: 30S ribosomal protein S2 [Prochloraceae cyanobacterium]|nr:30S ribosomal protein S2 [Prochloraceae cyanobacterium]